MTRPRPRGWLRLALRLPSGLYRLGLGGLLGERFLLLTHTGRRTGLCHRTVLEVLRHDRETDAYVVCSGWGPQAEWLRNIVQDPDVTVTVGRRELSARAELQSVDTGAAELADYARRHPLAFRMISRWFVGSGRAGASDFYRELAWSLPVVGLRAGCARGSPPRSRGYRWLHAPGPAPRERRIRWRRTAS